MHSNKVLPSVEHFVTLFYNNFLPMGLCLHESLMKHGKPFCLWIVCMDTQAEDHLELLSLPNTRLISLASVETKALKKVKVTRTAGEYCWTLTPFTAQFVFERDPTASRVTYLDADLFFFDCPNVLLDELTNSKKHVLITEHAYDPRYEKSGRSQRGGRFCVQFLTFRNTPEAAKVMHWWQARCLEWCYNKVEDGKFGDQKYLDVWPDIFANEVHILKQTSRTVAPWNVLHLEKINNDVINPVFYHFHGFRLESKESVLLYSGYRVGVAGEQLYHKYLYCLTNQLKKLNEADIAIPYIPRKKGLINRLIHCKRRFIDGEKTMSLQDVG